MNMQGRLHVHSRKNSRRSRGFILRNRERHGIFAIPFTKPPELKGTLELPGLLSWMAFGDINAHIKGINEFPAADIPLYG